MAKYSQKLMGKEVGQADVYAEPHTMTGKKVKAQSNPGKDTNLTSTDKMHMSIGNYNNRRNEPGIKSTGIKQRGSGAAVKGFTSKGPMA